MKQNIKNIYNAKKIFANFMAYATGKSDEIFGHKYQSKSSKKLTIPSHHPHQGNREKARRLRQRAEGKLSE